jgi:hypothetical protein
VNIAFIFPRISCIAGCLWNCLDTRHSCIEHRRYSSAFGEQAELQRSFSRAFEERAERLHGGDIQTSYGIDDKRMKEEIHSST